MPRELGNSAVGDAEWINLPPGKYRLSVQKIDDAPPGQYPDSPSIFVRYIVPAELRDKVKTQKLEEGQRQRWEVNDLFGMTLGSPEKRTKLWNRIAILLGPVGTEMLSRWLDADGPFNPEWLVGLQLIAQVTHQVKGDRAFARIEGAISLDDCTEAERHLLAQFQTRNRQLADKLFPVGVPTAQLPTAKSDELPWESSETVAV